jgi:hypothetical protein
MVISDPALRVKDFFGAHGVIGRTLEGEKVGAWFDDAT